MFCRKCGNADDKGIALKYGIIGIIGVIFIFAMLVSVSAGAKKCLLSGCERYKAEGSDYCIIHICEAEGCERVKSEYDKYCDVHEKELCCIVEDCSIDKAEGEDYCYFHSCKKADCTNRKLDGNDYCMDHQIDMREKLINSLFYFTLNSADEIEFNFKAVNSTGKDIKCVRFNVELKNSAGNLVKDEIKDAASVDVEIAGPVKNGTTVSMKDEIIGRCDTCARIDIDDITIVYADGTCETGYFGGYFRK